jgi:hypothetical protein
MAQRKKEESANGIGVLKMSRRFSGAPLKVGNDRASCTLQVGGKEGLTRGGCTIPTSYSRRTIPRIPTKLPREVIFPKAEAAGRLEVNTGEHCMSQAPNIAAAPRSKSAISEIFEWRKLFATEVAGYGDSRGSKVARGVKKLSL